MYNKYMMIMNNSYIYNPNNFEDIAFNLFVEVYDETYDMIDDDKVDVEETKFSEWTDEQLIELNDYLAKKFQSDPNFSFDLSTCTNEETIHLHMVYSVVSSFCDHRHLTSRLFDPYKD